jgi:formamidopyrimidine-DNA glycosylase
MPELPEVETMRRGIERIVGGTICGVAFPRVACKPMVIWPNRSVVRRRLMGRTVTAVQRIGKRVALVFDRDHLVIEPRMTGLLLLADPPSLEHLRLGLTLEFRDAASVRSLQLWYWDRRGLGQIRWLTARAWQQWLDQRRVGPDALQISLLALRERLSSSRRAIKVALLDQRALAGVGNLYASEILFAAGIHPQARCDRLSRVQWRRLHQALRRVLSAAVLYEGSTLSDGTYRNALNRAGQYQNHHRVYARSGQACARCHNAEIVRMVQAQRSTFFCPACQILPPDDAEPPTP